MGRALPRELRGHRAETGDGSDSGVPSVEAWGGGVRYWGTFASRNKAAGSNVAGAGGQGGGRLEGAERGPRARSSVQSSSPFCPLPPSPCSSVSPGSFRVLASSTVPSGSRPPPTPCPRTPAPASQWLRFPDWRRPGLTGLLPCLSLKTPPAVRAGRVPGGTRRACAAAQEPAPGKTQLIPSPKARPGPGCWALVDNSPWWGRKPHC